VGERASLGAVVKIEILMSPGCSHGQRTSELVAEIVREHAPAAAIEAIMVASPADAARLAFPGSPTVRVNGVDIEPEAPRDVGLG
jgi:hypothetical protein